MTLFQHGSDMEVSVSPQFDREYKPGEAPSHSGIYRCRGCGCEILAEPLTPFPPVSYTHLTLPTIYSV